jgi:hypothetical protein
MCNLYHYSTDTIARALESLANDSGGALQVESS